jgi:hypothetical protein
MKAAATATMEAATAAMKATATVKATTTAATTVAAAALSECRIWRESKTDERGKYEKGSEKTESAHNLYLPPNLGVQARATSLSSRTARS